VFCTDFLLLQFGIAFFWQKSIAAKAARQMFVKLITGFYVLRVCIVVFVNKKLFEKAAHKNVSEIDNQLKGEAKKIRQKRFHFRLVNNLAFPSFSHISLTY